jgi:hypothetical protein
MCDVQRTAEVEAEFWWGEPRVGDHLGDQGLNGMIILKWILKN